MTYFLHLPGSDPVAVDFDPQRGFRPAANFQKNPALAAARSAYDHRGAPLVHVVCGECARRGGRALEAGRISESPHGALYHSDTVDAPMTLANVEHYKEAGIRSVPPARSLFAVLIEKPGDRDRTPLPAWCEKHRLLELTWAEAVEAIAHARRERKTVKVRAVKRSTL